MDILFPKKTQDEDGQTPGFVPRGGPPKKKPGVFDALRALYPQSDV